MASSVALLTWLLLLIALFYFDPARERKESKAILVPLVWMFFIGSRLPSLWLGGGRVSGVAQALQEGNGTDRIIDLTLILLSIVILARRRIDWGGFAARNGFLLAYVAFGVVSIFWSDFPFVAFKRWIRDIGSYLVVLVALSDAHPEEAVRALLRKLSYLLVPLSIVLVKYFPELGRQYERWHGTAMYTGVATSKNGLGLICLMSGLFFVWDTVSRWNDRRSRRTKRILLVNGIFIVMTLWLLRLSNSATSRVCFVIGCVVIVLGHSSTFRHRRRLLTTLIPVCIGVYMIGALGFGLNDALAKAAGRDPTLTSRTEIWKILLSMGTNPLVGTGYASFWLGSRLTFVWSSPVHGITEAHNGYLETYLDLGVIGVLLLSVFLWASYRTICQRMRSSTTGASLELALWTVLVFYNVTEAAFKISLMWSVFLLAGIAVPQYVRQRRQAELRDAIDERATGPRRTRFLMPPC